RGTQRVFNLSGRAASAVMLETKPTVTTPMVRLGAALERSLFWANSFPVIRTSSKMLFVPVNAAQLVPPTGIFETVGGGFPVFCGLGWNPLSFKKYGLQALDEIAGAHEQNPPSVLDQSDRPAARPPGWEHHRLRQLRSHVGRQVARAALGDRSGLKAGRN